MKPEKPNPKAVLLDGMLAAACGAHPSGAIERSELRGISQLAESSALPTSWGWGTSAERAAELDALLAELGFELGEPYADDPLFRPGKDPEGWTREADYAQGMSVRIFDPEGRPRALLFYKAAFYDRKADMNLYRRVMLGMEPGRPWALPGEGEPYHRVVYAIEAGRDITILAEFEDPDLSTCERNAQRWLDAHYPDNMNPIAYWNDTFEGRRVAMER